MAKDSDEKKFEYSKRKDSDTSRGIKEDSSRYTQDPTPFLKRAGKKKGGVLGKLGKAALIGAAAYGASKLAGNKEETSQATEDEYYPKSRSIKRKWNPSSAEIDAIYNYTVPGYKKGGLIKKGFPKLAKKGWK